MTKYQILYWHDIPMQVRAREGRKRISKPLSTRFQEAVDRASMAAGLTGTDDYLDHLRWSEMQESDTSPEELVEFLIAEIEAAHESIDMECRLGAIGVPRQPGDRNQRMPGERTRPFSH